MFKLLAAISIVSVFAGCAAPAGAPQGQAGAQAAGVNPPSQTPITGSRLSRTSSDRLVKATDNATFRAGTEIRSLGNDVARPSN